VAGNTAEKALLRLDEDILQGSPNKATIMLGMNEGRYAHGKAADAAGLKEREMAATKFRDNMTTLVARLESKKIGITLIGPSIYDQTMDESVSGYSYKGFNDTLVKYKDFVQDLAKKKGWGFVDFNTPMLAVNASAQARDPNATIVGKDRVHPGPLGNYVMAYSFLKSQGVQGLVASVEIDARQAKAVQAVNCAVQGVECTGEQVSFRYEPKSLPFPIGDKTLPEADKLVPFTRDLNQELLKITGLKAGDYTVVINGADVANYSATQLEAGVNLAVEAKAPQQIKAQAVSVASGKFSQACARYRAVKLSEYYMKAAGIDTTQFEACKAYLEKYLDESNKKKDPVVAGYFKNYIEYKPKELSFLADAGTYQSEIYAKNKPGNYKVAVRLTTGAGS
jgi:lysophospholipase L1-like esterase